MFRAPVRSRLFEVFFSTKPNGNGLGLPTVRKTEFDPVREHWWAERGSIRQLHNEASLDAAIIYVRDAQDRKTETTRKINPV